MSIKLIEPVPIDRDANGYFTHPESPGWDADTAQEAVKSWLKVQGLELRIVLFESDAPQEPKDRWLEENAIDCSTWEPTIPEGDGWFVLSIHDTDNGPVCLWVRRLEPPKPRDIETSYFPSAEFRFFVHDPLGETFICFRTAEERDAMMKDIIDGYCDEGWSEEVEQVCIGEISGVAGKVNVKLRPEKVDEEGYDEDGSFWGEFESKCDYNIIPFPPRVSQAAQDVIAERRRQIEKEGWTPEHDDEHVDGEMAAAAACYAIMETKASMNDALDGEGRQRTRFPWPWSWSWWKPRSHRENLVRAGGLILADIERLDRAAAKAGGI